MCQVCSAVLHQDTCNFASANKSVVIDAMEYLWSDQRSEAASLTSLSAQEVTGRESGDVVGDISTDASIDIGGRFEGTISSASDTDYIEVTLTAGESYVLTAFGVDGNSGLRDTVLTLYDRNGAQITSNDDIDNSAGVLFSQITYTATSSGTYYLAVDGYASNTGNYAVEVATDTFTVEDVVSQITEIGWGYNTPIRLSTGANDTITYNLTGLTAEGRALAEAALESWAAVTGLTFVATTSTSAGITFGDDRGGAFAGASSGINTDTGVYSRADVNVNTSWLDSFGSTIDSYSFSTYIHEIGHALGLMHSGHYNGTFNFATDAHYRNDSLQMSIMSYGDNNSNPNISYSSAEPITPMIADIAAVQLIYGETTINGGNTVWGANSNLGGYLGRIFGYVFDGDTPDPSLYSGGDVMFTIADTQGNDTFDLSSVSVNQTIDLRPEGISDVNGQTGNVVIAQNTIIENFIGGSGNDRILANRGDNNIDGRGGTDTAVIGTTQASVSVFDLGGNQVEITFAGGGTDTFTAVENFEFTDGTVSLADLQASGGSNSQVLNGDENRNVLIGSSGSDSIFGNGGNDRLDGQAGNDAIYGGAGDDQILGRGGNDRLFGGDGDDNIAASDGDDTVYGGNGDDKLGGGNGTDVLYGEDGNDTIGSGNGNDMIFAGDGDDVTSGGYGEDEVRGGAGNDTMAGSFGVDFVDGEDGDDTLGGGTGNDRIEGGAGNDTIGAGDDNDLVLGESGDDFLGGGAGNDNLRGGGGDDILNGGTGNDLLTGGADNDTFVFRAGPAQRDTITDFEDGSDMIRLIGLGSSISDLSIRQAGANVEISSGSTTIVLQNTRSSEIDSGDFIFQ